MKRAATPVRRLFATAAAVALSLFAGAASAKNVSGAAAKAVSGADQSCAKYDYGFVTNNCSTAKGFIIALPYVSEGYKNVSFVGYGATSSNDVACKASGWNNTYTGFNTTSTVSLPAYGSPQTVSLGSVYVWNPGALYFYCTIQPGGKLYMVSWDE